jgi:uncharacterized membrane protein YecN with MAPEG domain
MTSEQRTQFNYHGLASAIISSLVPMAIALLAVIHQDLRGAVEEAIWQCGYMLLALPSVGLIYGIYAARRPERRGVFLALLAIYVALMPFALVVINFICQSFVDV